MFEGLLAGLSVWLLKRTKLSLENRSKLLNAMMDNMSAKPIHDIISFDNDGYLYVSGKPATHDEATALREGARAALKSIVLGRIQSQVLHEAYTLAANQATSVNDLFFAKAAIWWGQHENALLVRLATYGEQGS